MSLINAWVEPQRALFAVDTRAADSDGNVCETSKLFLLAKDQAVFAYRGFNLFCMGVYDKLVMSGAGVDVIMRSMREALAEVETQCVSCGIPEAMLRVNQEVAIVGWSKTQSRFVGRAWRRFSPVTPFQILDADPIYACYWDDTFRTAHPSSPKAMATLMCEQVQFAAKHEPQNPAGGRMVLATLTPGRVEITSGYEIT